MLSTREKQHCDLQEGDLVKMRSPIVSMRCLSVHRDRCLVQFILADKSTFYGHWPTTDLMYVGPG